MEDCKRKWRMFLLVLNKFKKNYKIEKLNWRHQWLNTMDKHLNIEVVGVTGFKRHGKDTVGDHLCDQYGFTKLAFADPLKEICKILFSFDEKQLYGDSKEIVDSFWGFTPRKTFETIGTEIFRETLPNYLPEIGLDIWIKSLEKKMLTMYKQNPDKYNKFVITDVRFPNELKFIRKYKGTLYKVQRHEVLEDELKLMHDSERFIPELKEDVFFYNTGDLEHLYTQIDYYVEMLSL